MATTYFRPFLVVKNTCHTETKEGNRNKIRVWFDNQLQQYRYSQVNPKILKLFEKYDINIEKIDKEKREAHALRPSTKEEKVSVLKC